MVKNGNPGKIESMILLRAFLINPHAVPTPRFCWVFLYLALIYSHLLQCSKHFQSIDAGNMFDRCGLWCTASSTPPNLSCGPCFCWYSWCALLKGIWQNMCCMDCMVSRWESFFSWEGFLGAVVVVVVVIVAVVVGGHSHPHTRNSDHLPGNRLFTSCLSGSLKCCVCLKGCNTCQETNGFCGGTCLGYCSQMLAWTICVRAMPMIHWAHKSILDQFLCLGVEISFAQVLLAARGFLRMIDFWRLGHCHRNEASMGTLFRSISNGLDWSEAVDTLLPVGDIWIWLFYLYIAFNSFSAAEKGTRRKPHVCGNHGWNHVVLGVSVARLRRVECHDWIQSCSPGGFQDMRGVAIEMLPS